MPEAGAGAAAGAAAGSARAAGRTPTRSVAATACKKCGGELVQRTDDDQRRGAGASQGVPARHEAGARVLPRTADVPRRQRRAAAGARGARDRHADRRCGRRAAMSDGSVRGDCLPVAERDRQAATGEPAGGADSRRAAGDGGARCDDARRSMRWRSAGARSGRGAGVQGLPRVSGDDVRVGERAGGSRDPVDACAGRGRHHLHRHGRQAGWVLRRLRGDGAGGPVSPEAARAAARDRGGAVSGDRRGEAGRAGLGYRRGGPAARRGARVFGGARVRRARHRDVAARGAADRELRARRTGTAAGGGHGPRHRADGERWASRR